MPVFFKSFKNLYKDSVSLMQITAKVISETGIEKLSVAMQTKANLQRAKVLGLNFELEPSPNDLMAVFEAQNEDEALKIFNFIEKSLTSNEKRKTETKEQITVSIRQAKDHQENLNFALISVPGSYAAAEALKALKSGLNVMLFSDNVSEKDELMLKKEAVERDLLMMGPDCGTAVINGLPLGFANVLRKGNIGLVGASGTGLQEVSCAISNLGCGLSQVIGTGGRDLHENIGGLMTLYSLDLLSKDVNTKVIGVISKPPAADVKEKIIAKLKEIKKPVVVHFVGDKNSKQQDENIIYASSLVECAEIACNVLENKEIGVSKISLPKVKEQRLGKICGIFCGGTFCAEAQSIALACGFEVVSNVPIDGAKSLNSCGLANIFIDMGDDEFTNGRPHPMIDPSLRDEYFAKSMGDHKIKVILFDVVLGYGASLTPLDGLKLLIKKNTRSDLHLVCHVCGTDEDPQSLKNTVCELQNLGVKVAKSNYEATLCALSLL